MLLREVVEQLKNEGLPIRRQYLYEIIMDLESVRDKPFTRRTKLLDLTKEEYEELKKEVMRRRGMKEPTGTV